MNTQLNLALKCCFVMAVTFDVREITGNEDSVAIGDPEAGGAETKFYRAVAN